MDAWVERTNATGANLYDNGLRINSTQTTEEEDKCVEFGEGFAKF
jgi:hypothetical protein